MLVVLAGLARRPQGDPGGRERSPRIDGELARGPAGSPAPGPARAPRRGRRRPSRDLGRPARRLPDGRRATVLEPPTPEPPRQGAHATPGRGEEPAYTRSPTPRRVRGPSGRSGRSRHGPPRRASPPWARPWTTTGRGWSRSISFRRRTGSISGRRTRLSRRSPRSGCGPRRPSGSSGRERDGRHLEDAAVAEQTFRRLDAPELLAEVAEGVTYINGVRVKPSPATTEEKAAA